MISTPVSTRPIGHKSEVRARTQPSYELWTVLSTLTLLYVLAMLEGNRRFVWFDELWDRHVITTTVVIYIGIAILLGLRPARNRYAGYAAAAVLFVFCVRTGGGEKV